VSLLVVGLSHRSAPIHLLERAALGAARARELAALAVAPAAASASEALVLATCNRLELYAEVPSFHAGVRHLSSAVSRVTGVSLDDLADHLYFHHGERAVHHLFTVAGGLDSMALGESQVLGQVRAALRGGQEDGTVGPQLQRLVQQALRVGKRVQTETGLDRAGTSLVEAGLDGVEQLLGRPVGQLRALVVGAGSMSALAASTLHRRGVAAVTVANRSAPRARRLAEQLGGAWLVLDDEAALRTAIAGADVVVSCTGATGTVLDAVLVAAAREERRAVTDGDQLVVDLALPHDVDPLVAALPGVHLVGLADLRSRLMDAELDVDAARAIVDEEVAALLAARRAAVVAPTVTALRAHAREVVDAELARLRQRSARHGADLDPRVAAELELTVHRVVEKLLHTPTVRVKELAAGSEGGASYATALRHLFDLPADLSGTGPDGSPDVAEVLRVDAAASGGAGAGPGAAPVGSVGALHATRGAP
jgi:glutamyl-tRNA reductase